MDKNKYAVASTLIKNYGVGKLNIMVDLRKIEAVSKEEAMGIYITAIVDEFPEHNVHCKPVAMIISEV